MEKLGDIPNKCNHCGKELVTGDKEVEIAVFQGEYYHKLCYLKVIPEQSIKVLLVVSPRSIGDAISHTPLVKEFKRIYPDTTIDVLTVFPDLFRWNENVNNVIPMQDGSNSNIFKRYDAVYTPFDTKGPYHPYHMLCHSVDFVSYGMFRKFLKPEHKQYEVFYTYQDVNKLDEITEGIDLERDNIILIHPHKAYWETRTWDMQNWQNIVDKIKTNFPQHKIISIGGSRDSHLSTSKMENRVELNGCIDLYNKLSLLETLALMDFSRTLVTLDTGPLHMAGASRINIACAFTVVNSLYRLPYRDGIFGKDCFWIDTDCEHNIYNHKFMTESTNITKCPKNYNPVKCLPTVDDFWKIIRQAIVLQNWRPYGENK
jgi:ADP-heptose:LPS heptosyltransferase